LLYLVELVELHRGSMHVTSWPGAGTTVNMTMPVYDAALHHASTAWQQEKQGVDTMEVNNRRCDFSRELLLIYPRLCFSLWLCCLVELVELHGACIDIISWPGAGTTNQVPALPVYGATLHHASLSDEWQEKNRSIRFGGIREGQGRRCGSFLELFLQCL
jgi:hypothetical protein